MTRRRRAAIFLVIAALAVACDQGSKAWARTLPAGPQRVIDGYWDWELAYNPGAAFSTFAGPSASRVLLSLLACGALVGIGIAAARTPPGKRMRLAALALLAGGALGNLIDRVRDGAVTDFVRWRIHAHLWPIFNVADAALLVGVVVLLVDGVRDRRLRAAPA